MYLHTLFCTCVVVYSTNAYFQCSQLILRKMCCDQKTLRNSLFFIPITIQQKQKKLHAEFEKVDDNSRIAT